MTRQAALYGAINLSQGFPDFAAPTRTPRTAEWSRAATGTSPDGSHAYKAPPPPPACAAPNLSAGRTRNRPPRSADRMAWFEARPPAAWLVPYEQSPSESSGSRAYQRDGPAASRDERSQRWVSELHVGQRGWQ